MPVRNSLALVTQAGPQLRTRVAVSTLYQPILFNLPGLRCTVGHFGSSARLRRSRDPPRHPSSGAGIEAISATWLACDCGDTPPEATYFAWIDLAAPSPAVIPQAA
jgi:hypothetical protein